MRSGFSTVMVLITEWLDGDSLAFVQRCLETGSEEIDVADLKHIMLDVLTALAYCFQKGVVHRDVMPRNVMVTETRVVLLDFGNACLMSDVVRAPYGEDDGLVCGHDEAIYMVNRVARTAARSDPFLRQEKRGAVDWMNADVWDAGVMFYQLSERRDPRVLPCPRGERTAPLVDPPIHGDVLTREIIKACMSCDLRVRREILEEEGVLQLFRSPPRVIRILDVCHSALMEAEEAEEGWDWEWEN